MSDWTPVTPRTGGLVHATSMRDPARTACGKRFIGWNVSTKTLSCSKCQLALEGPGGSA